MPTATVLVADDDPDILTLVATVIERSGHTVVRSRDGVEAMKAVYDRRPDVVVLDIGMPQLDGWQVLQRIREITDVPVLMLSADSGELEKVRALRGGADDFVTKPFGVAELQARVDVLLRRARISGGREHDVTALGPLQVDHLQRTAKAADEELTLTPREFRLLEAFVRNPRQLLSGEQIVDAVWGDPFVSPEQVKVLVGRLRRKLDGRPAGRVETVRGFGYRFIPPEGG